MSASEDQVERGPLGGRGRTVLPASQFLQHRLHERRVQNIWPRRARHTDIGPRRGLDDDIFLHEAEAGRGASVADSSPLAAGVMGSDAGGQRSDRRRRPVGGKEMDTELDRLGKQNFALKLELVHRREQAHKLQHQLDGCKDQVERAAEIEKDYRELQKISTELVQELERRDRAIEEAMNIICDLEERVHGLQERNHNDTRPSTAHADSGYAETEPHDPDPPSSPPVSCKPAKVSTEPSPEEATAAASVKLQGMMGAQTPARPNREPSILSSKKPSTQALRKVYMESAQSLHPVKSFQSLLSRQEARDEENVDEPSSPRLSNISESSFPSIYSPREKIRPDRYDWESDEEDDTRTAPIRSRAHVRQDSIKRVSQWIEERDEAGTTPSKSNRISSLLPDDASRSMSRAPRNDDQPGHYSSLNDALSAASGGGLASAVELQQQPQLRRQQRSKQTPPSSTAGPFFGDILPPTPGSDSTRMLRASRSSTVEDKRLLDTTPAAVKGFNALEPGVRSVPRRMRSLVELKSAYASNMHCRSTKVNDSQGDDGSDEDYTGPDADNDTVKDFVVADYDGFPDGKSLLMGTPSRFQDHGQPPADLMFNMDERSPTQHVTTRPRRRRSSEEPVTGPAKPRLSRGETSPTIFGGIGRMFGGGGRSSAETVKSPRSGHSRNSASSGKRTVVAGDGSFHGALSPEPPRAASSLSPSVTSPSRSRTSSSPARTLSKKTQSLFRRLSNSQGGDRDKPSLPALTSTPSSAYAPSAAARPQTSHNDRSSTKSSVASGAIGARGSREAQRPSSVIWTRTEPATTRPASAGGTAHEKRTLFRRSSSTKKGAGSTPDPPHRGAPPKRRGSLRDAVTARRPWR